MDASSDAQVRALLSDAGAALQADYAELYSPLERKHVAVGSDDVRHVLDRVHGFAQYALGNGAQSAQEPLIVGEAELDALWGSHPLVTAASLRSIMVLPLVQSGKPHTIFFGWKQGRSTVLSEEDKRYAEFLARVVSRLLDNAERERELSSRMILDPLTGLHNRAATLEQISVALSAAERSGSEMAVFYVDFDGFKQVNDTYGHAFGDTALAQSASRMRSVLRKHELAGRIGGDEFALLITSFSGDVQLEQIAKRVLTALRDPVSAQGVKTGMRASIGIAIYPRHGRSADDLLAHADAAMYQAKRVAGQGFAFFGEPEERPAQVQHLFGAQLASNTAMEREFFLCYQPIVDARTRKTVGAEALVRWLHPGMGMLSPRAFLDASRDQRTLSRIEQWVLGTALEKHAKLRAAGRRLAMHVNVSEPSDELLEFAQQSAGELRIEVPEQAVAGDESAYVPFLQACNARGFRVGLSNFGCGGLSLRVLAELPLDFVKVGRGVIPDSQYSKMMTSSVAVIEAAHRFKWRVIAERVEEHWQREWLVSHGVDALQGYNICSPLTDSDFESWLQVNRS